METRSRGAATMSCDIVHNALEKRPFSWPRIKRLDSELHEGGAVFPLRRFIFQAEWE